MTLTFFLFILNNKVKKSFERKSIIVINNQYKLLINQKPINYKI